MFLMTCHVQIYNWVPPLKPIMKPKIPGEKCMDCYDMFAHSENCWTLGSDDVWMRIWYSEKKTTIHILNFLKALFFLNVRRVPNLFLESLKVSSKDFETSQNFWRFWSFGKLQRKILKFRKTSNKGILELRKALLAFFGSSEGFE